MVLITVRTSPDVLRALVPDLLAVNADSHLSIYVSKLNITHPRPGTYGEAGVLIPASFRGTHGSYMPVLYLDQVRPIIIGREVWGFPKFPADVHLAVGDGAVHASVVVETTALIDATLRLDKPIEPTRGLPSPVFLLKAIPSVTGGSAYDVKQLTTAVLRNSVFDQVWPGQATLQLQSTPADPLGEIPILAIVDAVYTIGGFALDYGEVLFDYLLEDRKK
jgi:acetoacetate decarboxylase